MNCPPAPLPTFFAPLMSNGGPPAVAVPVTGADGAGGAATGGAPDTLEPKPQPVFPAWVEAPGPEQIPVGLAQHPLPQSASLRHWPVINWRPAPLPTFATPAGSKGGTAWATRATGMILASVRRNIREKKTYD